MPSRTCTPFLVVARGEREGLEGVEDDPEALEFALSGEVGLDALFDEFEGVLLWWDQANSQSFGPALPHDVLNGKLDVQTYSHRAKSSGATS